MANENDDVENYSIVDDESGLPDEYYEEADLKTLQFNRQTKPKPKQNKVKPIVSEPPVPVDPVKKLNDDLNRKFRPDLVSFV